MRLEAAAAAAALLASAAAAGIAAADPSAAARAQARIEWSARMSHHVLRLAEQSWQRLQNGTANDLTQELIEAMGPIGPRCSDFEYIGRTRHVGNEHKMACGLSRARTPCTVLSLGSMNDWTFEAWVHRHTRCRIETFDCTLPNSTRPPQHLADRIRFHHACASGSSHEVEVGQSQLTVGHVGIHGKAYRYESGSPNPRVTHTPAHGCVAFSHDALFGTAGQRSRPPRSAASNPVPTAAAEVSRSSTGRRCARVSASRMRRQCC